MGNTLYVDSNVKRFTSDKISSLPITLLTDVVLPITIKTDIHYQACDTNGNLLYLDSDNNITGDEYEYSVSDESLFDTSSVDTIIGEQIGSKMLFNTKREKNKPYIKNAYKTEIVSIDDNNCLGLSVDDVLYQDAVNLLEHSEFDKVIIDIMDCIVGGDFSNFCSYKVTLKQTNSVIFNISTNIKEGILMYNIPSDLDIYINSIKIPKIIVDDNMGIYYSMESTELNIKIVNSTMNTISIVNPIILVN